MPVNTFCELYHPQSWEDTRVYHGSIIGYSDFVDENGHVIPTMQILITTILYGQEDFPSDTFNLIGADGANCGAEFPIEFGDKIIFQVVYNEDFGSYCGIPSPNSVLNGCGPSYLNYENGQVLGTIGGGIPSGVSLEDFTAALGIMEGCALSTDVDDPFFNQTTISVFPNPTTDLLNIQFQERVSAETQLALIAIDGRKVTSGIITAGTLNH